MIGHISHVVGSFGGFHAVCECGWVGNDRGDREFAETDRSLHVMTIDHAITRKQLADVQQSNGALSTQLQSDRITHATALEAERAKARELVRPTNGEAPLESEWWRERIPVLAEAVRTQRWFDVLELLLVMAKQTNLELKAVWAQYALGGAPR